MIPILQNLDEIGLLQPPSPLQTRNSNSEGVFNNTIVPRKIESVVLRFHWLCYFKSKIHFHYYWAPGLINWVYYSTKHHTTAYHERNRMIHSGTKHYLYIPIWIYMYIPIDLRFISIVSSRVYCYPATHNLHV